MSKVDESDDDDWFNKDESELLKDLKLKVETAKNSLNNEIREEHIEVSYDEKYLQQWRLNVCKQTQQKSTKIPTSDLRKLAEAGNGLDAFLYAVTVENHDFFNHQICANDAMDRVFIYLRLYAMIAELKIPGFHNKFIKHFVQDENLFDQICLLTTKVFTKRYKTLWKTDNDKLRLDKFISDIQLLLLQAFSLKMLTPKAISTMKHIKRLLKVSDSTEVINRTVVLKFASNLEEISIEEEVSDAATEPVYETNKQLCEIYPTLNELLDESVNNCKADSDMSLVSHVYQNVGDYLNIQKSALRDDFVLSLADCVQELKTNRTLNSALAGQVLLYENVEIILNENFLAARRHEMLFVNILPESYDNKKKLKDVQLELKSLKTGSLLCLTTSYDFDNLIIAVVTYQDIEFSKNGYVAIEVVRQFNIGNIYNKKFMMFSSPAFFEPYHNVYNYLNTCSVDDFPMKDIIIFGKHESTQPNYITNKTIYNTDKCKFKPLQEEPPIKLPLNSSQRKAMQTVLTQKLALIQGPPGTGKTHLSVQLVKLLLENETPKPIVVVAYTNESLDKFLLKISTYTTSIARLGGQTRLPEISRYMVSHGPLTSDHVNPRLKRLWWLVNTEFKAAFQELQNVQRDFDGTDEGYEQVLKAQNKVREFVEQINTLRVLFNYYVVRDRSIVALTTTCAAKMNFLFRLLGCKIFIFEEAAEILESHVLACLTPQTEHMIMIGDHMQLKPFTSNYQHSRSCDLNVSLFERLINRGTLTPAVLLTQYRMRPVIADLMCPTFYDVLYNDDSVENYPLVRGMKENLYFFQHEKRENQSKLPSVCNPHEVTEIIKLTKYLTTEAQYKTEDIVILSPYALQCGTIKGKLPPHLKPIRVMTVDSFQGLEANIVLLSLVRSNKEGQIGFLQEKNRICVALSRAKQGFYIIGNLKMLMSLSKTWQEIGEKLYTLKLVGQTFPFAKEIENINILDPWEHEWEQE